MPESLQIETSYSMERGLKAYKEFVDICTFDGANKDMDLLNIPEDKENIFLRICTPYKRILYILCSGFDSYAPFLGTHKRENIINWRQLIDTCHIDAYSASVKSERRFENMGKELAAYHLESFIVKGIINLVIVNIFHLCYWG